MIDHVRKLIFVHIARTGGSSIETALVGKDWWSIDPSTKHISATAAREIYGEEIWSTYHKFTVVRNPWDRIVSMWATKWWHRSSELDDCCSFDEFIKNIKPHPHERYNTLFYHQILNEKMDSILRFETLREDFARMLNSVGADDVPLPHVEKREHAHYTTMYNAAERRSVFERFHADIVQFNYC